jgi:hypothetical protein
MVAAWATFTRMPGRFIVPAVVPLALLSGLGAAAISGTAVRRVALFALLAGAGAIWNDATLADQLKRHSDWYAARGVRLPLLLGATETFARYQPLNEMIPAGARVWLVGDARAFYLPPGVHYTVVFDRDPWLEYARTATPAQAVAWLRTQHAEYVVFSWPEIDRLRRTYGFSPLVTRPWVEQLAAAGLQRLSPPGGDNDVEVYEVPSK